MAAGSSLRTLKPPLFVGNIEATRSCSRPNSSWPAANVSRLSILCRSASATAAST
jgi:hypothetical protein